jgi:hypothetical protein
LRNRLTPGLDALEIPENLIVRREEFRTGSLSLPASDADEVPSGCFACPYLSYKEFSMNEAEGLFYYYCAYYALERSGQELPPCLREVN